MVRTYITPYSMGSKSAKELARSLGVLRVKGDKRLRTCSVINWGRSDLSLKGFVKRVINSPSAVALAVDKVKALTRLQQCGVSVVEFTTNRPTALGWAGNGDMVFARTTASSSQGRGIVLVGMGDTMPNAPLYTKAFTKTHEYRVHVAFGKVIDFSKKRKRTDTEVNPHIKNSSNGWVFCREGIALPDIVASECLKAVRALGLDFGAIDVLYKERDNVSKILEINCSPGIEGTTLEKYKQAFLLELGDGRWVLNREGSRATTSGWR